MGAAIAKLQEQKHNMSAFVFIMRESSYCFQRVLSIAILSVCLSHGWISQKRAN